MNQRELSLCLRILDASIVVGCLWFCLGIIPIKADEALAAHGAVLGWAFAVVSCIPLLAIGVLAWRLFADIGRNRSFSTGNAARLRLVSLFALAEGILFFAAMIVIAALGLLTSGALAVALVITIACFALAIVSATLSHLTRKAAQLQDENDLTV